MSDQTEWDVSLARRSIEGNTQAFQLTVPAPVARALDAQGYNRAKLTLTSKGLLYSPYTSDVKAKTRKITASLPFAS